MAHSHPLGRAGHSYRSAPADSRRALVERLEDRRLLAAFATGDFVQFESVRYPGRYLDGDDAASGYDVDTRSDNSQTDTDWKVRSDNNGIYSFENVQYVDRWLDGDSGDNVDQRLGDDFNDTNWRLTNVGGDVYRLENVQFGGRYLDADGSNAGWKVDLNGFSNDTDLQWRITPVGGGTGGQSTFGNGGNPWAVGSTNARRIQAENFDAGGNGVAWNELTSANLGGGTYRSNAPGVDVFGDSAPGAGIGYFDQGEWLEYTINVASAGNHTLRLRGAVDGSGSFRASFNRANKTGDVAFGTTGGWGTYATRSFTVNLAAGQQVLRIEKVNGGGLNLDWVELQKQATSGGTPGLITVAELDNRGSGYAYSDGLLTNQSTMNSDITAQYAEWKSKYLKSPSQNYVNANGGGTMYFVTGYDQAFVGVPNSAVSEGLGYGLVAAALANDKPTFDGLWNFGKTKLNQYGVLEWLYYGDGYTVQTIPNGGGSGSVNATDGDLDAAYGLMAAAVRWGGSYAADAKTLIGNVLEVNVTDDNYLNSGSDGYDGSSATLNRPLVTSYLSPGYFRMFADFTGVSRWDAVADTAVTQLRNNQNYIRNNYGNNGDSNRGGSGLFSFRVEKNGSVSPEAGSASWNSDVGRMMWRISKDYAWYGNTTSRTMMEDFNKFARRQGIGDLYESYNMSGQETAPTDWRGTDAGWNAMSVATSLLVSGSQSERNDAWNIVKPRTTTRTTTARPSCWA